MNDKLLFRYITDQSDDTEKREVRKWLSASKEREQELSMIKNSWVLSGLHNELDPLTKERAIRAIIEKIKALNKRPVQKLNRAWLKYAAAILLGIGLTSFGYFFSTLRLSSPGYTEVIVPKGERSKVILPDGSAVQINGGSQLKFEPAFQSGKRKVLLEGEAFFEVTHDQFNPFVVETGFIEVEVLGTRFNVSNYADDEIVSTFLESGSVKIRMEGKKDILLHPSQVLNYEKITQNTALQIVDDHRFSDWTRGMLNIRGETIEALAKKLERRFNVEIQFGDQEVQNHMYSGTINDENLSTVLEALHYTSSISSKHNGRTVTLYSPK